VASIGDSTETLLGNVRVFVRKQVQAVPSEKNLEALARGFD
jgi:hypothetical protein